MKKSTSLLLAFTAGAAIAGATRIFLATRRGKTLKRKVVEKGEKMIEDAEEIISEAKNRFEDLRVDIRTGGISKNGKTKKSGEDIVM